MTTFLFWNLNRKRLETTLVQMVHGHNVDMLLCVECQIPPTVLLELLESPDQIQFRFTPCKNKSFGVYTRFPSKFLSILVDEPRYTIFRIGIPARSEIIFAILHFPSKIWSGESLTIECVDFSKCLRETEKQVGHARTVVIGDFNLNPFEDGMVAATGLNAVMTREVASKGHRTVHEKRYPYFYNPMWKFFGDLTEGPAGTYYYSQSEKKAYYWHIFDQALLRPDVLTFFDPGKLKILTEVDGVSLFKNGLPDKELFSDHLPLLLTLNH
ncbi:MAG: hypothetical protein K1Y36_19325 [Blastocatellia bacterium]|nr:hypothetical protein [Blastocatellia bacterium]